MDKISTLADRLEPYIRMMVQEALSESVISTAGATTTTTIDETLYLKADGTVQLNGNLPVAPGKTIDNVDVSALADQYSSHIGSDVHQQYAGADGSGITRTAYQAARLTKSVLAGNGLTGGGVLDTDRALNVGAGTGISVAADTVAIDEAANFLWAGLHQFQQKVVTHDLEPDLTDTRHIGTTDKRYLTADISEIRSTVFAEYSIHPVGGFILITKDQGVLSGDVPAQSFQTIINFGRVMTVGDMIELRDNGKVELMKIIAAQAVFGVYSCQRDLDGSGPNFWAAGSVYAVKGQLGDGYLAFNAYDSPRMQVWKKGSAYNNDTEEIRIGDLNGNWGYGASTFGVAIGEYAAGKPNITSDPVHGLRLRNYNTDVIRLDANGAFIDGNLDIDNGSITTDTVTINNADGITIYHDPLKPQNTVSYNIIGTDATLRLAILDSDNGPSLHQSVVGSFASGTRDTDAYFQAQAAINKTAKAYLRAFTDESAHVLVQSQGSTTKIDLFADTINALSQFSVSGNLVVTGIINGSLITPAWTNATLQNGWSNLSTLTYKGAGYCKNAVGKIHLRGVITNGTFANGTVLFTLLAGYRPDRRRIFTAAGHNNVGVRIDVDTNGNVMCYGLAGNSFLSLDGISFYPA